MAGDRLPREVIAMRVARELQDGDVVNLGIGIPSLCSQYVPEGRTILYHSESGVLNYGPMADEGEEDDDLINASGQFIKQMPGMSFFHSADAFGMIRGGHIDVTVLGALQVSEKGDLSNWMIPSRGIGNVGGAMDLAACAKRVFIAMEHTTREGGAKLLNKCTLPITAPGVVKMLVTDLGLFEITPQGFMLVEYAPGWTPEEIQGLTEAKLIISDDLKEFRFRA